MKSITKLKDEARKHEQKEEWEKAIKAYENRGAGLRHGIALDRQITVILSQSDNDRPLCGIYFNLHSPYSRKLTPTKDEVGTG